MPTYHITRARLEAEYSVQEIADLESRGASIATALDAANGTLDLALNSAGTVLAPTAVLPAAIPAALADIARYRLYLDPPEFVAKRWEAAIALLTDVARGKVSLATPSATTASTLAPSLKSRARWYDLDGDAPW